MTVSGNKLLDDHSNLIYAIVVDGEARATVALKDDAIAIARLLMGCGDVCVIAIPNWCDMPTHASN